MRRVALVGGSGFIGTRLSGAFIDDGWAATSFDLVAPQIPGVAWTRCDTRHERLNEASFESFDVIVHLAALLGHGCTDNPDDGWATNVLGTQHVIDAARRSNVPRILFFSSSMVDADPCHPDGSAAARACGRCVYRQSKRVGESLFAQAASGGGLDVAALRPFTVYGPGPANGKRGHFIASWAERAAAGLPLPIFGTGEQTVDLLHVDDLARLGVKAAGGTSLPGRLRLADAGTGKATPVIELARWFASVRPDITIEQNPLASVSRRDVADTRPALRQFGWRASIMPEAGMRSFLRKRLSPEPV